MSAVPCYGHGKVSAVRCRKCGLTQLAAATCRRCDAHLTRDPIAERPAALDLAPPHPFVGIWFSPRETVRSLVEVDPTRGVLVISWLGGLALCFGQMASRTSERFPLGGAFVAALLFGPLISFGLVFVQSHLLALTGRWLGGSATDVELRAALAWAQAPLLWLLVVVWLPSGSGTPEIARAVTALVPFVWSEILAVVLVSEVHGLSIRRAVATIALAWTLKIAVIVGIVLSAPIDSRPKASEPASIAP